MHNYDGQRAEATLKCKYPATSPDTPTAVINLENVLENLNHELFEVGAWLNVVGYVQNAPDSEGKKSTTRKDSKRPSRRPVLVAATMVWSAGAIKTDRYEAAVQGYQVPLDSG